MSESSQHKKRSLSKVLFANAILSWFSSEPSFWTFFKWLQWYKKRPCFSYFQKIVEKGDLKK